MRHFAHILLLVLLLLPFRGAMAVAGGLCDAAAEMTASGPAKPHIQHGYGHDGPAAHDVGSYDHEAIGSEAGDAPFDAHDVAADTCTFCAACCAALPLSFASVEVHALLPIGAERFPALASPRSFAAFGALDRPPRSA